MVRVAKDFALAEVTLRKYEKPSQLRGRELVRKVCLSLGLLQPGDSRDVVVDVFYVLLNSSRRRKALTCTQIEKEVIALRKAYKLPMLGIASSNIRRQLKRLRDIFLIEKVRNEYRITEFDSLSEIFKERIERFYVLSITSRIEDYLARADSEFKRKTRH